MADVRFTWLQRIVLLIARLGLAYLFFTQLFWKFPPTFGCPSDFSFSTGQVENGQVTLQRSSGLCDWIGVEAVWSERPRPFLVADMHSIDGPTLSVDLSSVAHLNGQFVKTVVQPNIRVMGWLIWGVEAFIVVTLGLGLLSRLGGLVALGQSLQLMIGLAGINPPYEWEWSYILMVLLALIMVAFPAGRTLGLDALLALRRKRRGRVATTDQAAGVAGPGSVGGTS
jgi:hypothetical protein